jgi:hypothetical protein
LLFFFRGCCVIHKLNNSNKRVGKISRSFHFSISFQRVDPMQNFSKDLFIPGKDTDLLRA